MITPYCLIYYSIW